MAVSHELQHALHVVHYVSPAAIIAYYVLAVTVSTCTLQNLKTRTSPRKILIGFTCMILLSYAVEACMLLIDTLANHGQFSSTDSNVYTLSNTLIWMVLAVSLCSTKTPVLYPHYGSWFIALVAEGLLLALGLSYGYSANAFTYARITFQACRLLLLIALPTLLFAKSSKDTTTVDEESATLLGQHKTSSTNPYATNGTSRYGSIVASTPEANLDYEAKRRQRKEEEQQKLKRRLQESGSWLGYISSYSILFPLMWPSKRRLLQLNIFGVGLCLLGTRALNVLVPRQLGIVLDRLGLSQGRTPIFEFLLFLLFGFLSSSVISPIRHLLWTPVELNMSASLKTAAYNQIMGLSRDFHTEKQSGELFMAIDQGSSITSLLDTVVFRIGPIFIDVVVAFSYLYHVFGPYMALNVAATTIVYLWASTYFIGKQSEPQRRAQGLARKEHQLMFDTVGGWSSVSYFNRQAYEQERYSQAVGLATLWQRKIDLMFYLAFAAQDTIIELGLIVAGTIAVYQISAGTLKVGSFAMLMTYWGSFTGSLEYIAHTQSQIRRCLVNAESLLELLQRKPTVKDGPHQFTFKCGSIHFHNVGFSYDGKKETIQDFTFHAGPGQKIALVGETGGGKSTILKLLFRFYDVQQGKILIDDQDIRDVTLHSLRQCIGVVPQDPALFNDSVMENVRYSKLGASDEEVIEACKCASIHDKILTFTEGYQTKVGENGVKLSGGELQRIAIARIILKNPDIILLDEATSAVDTETEAHIQEALQKLTKGRTTITIAHRLSTVTNSDNIVVIKGGKVVEQGSPRALLEAKGKFSELWLRQVGIGPAPTEEQPPDEKPAGDHHTAKVSDKEGNTHVSEASSSSAKSLRPTAPEFVPQNSPVPRYQQGTASQGGSSSLNLSTSDRRRNPDASTTKADVEKDKPHQKCNAPADSTVDAIGSGSQNDTSDAKNGSAGPTETKKKRPNPAQRHRNNKSEPSGSAIKPSQHAGPTEALTSDGSAENPAVSPQTRRVSAPGRPLSSITNGQEGGRAQRRRAQRWHQRKRQTSELAAASTSGEGGGSSTWSSETLHPETPVVRLPGPTDANASISGTNTPGPGTGSVHFAPGF